MRTERRRILRKFLFFKIFAAVLFGAATSASAGDLLVWDRIVLLETEQPASWARLVKLENGEWLAAGAVFGVSNVTKIRVKMYSWTFVTESGEDGRKIDNADLVQLSNGEIPPGRGR